MQSVFPEELFEKTQIGRLDYIGFVLIAVHKNRHWKSKNQFFPERHVSNSPLSELHRPQTFQSSRDQVHRNLWSTWGWLEKNGKCANETWNDNIPSVDLLTSVFGEAHHKSKCGHEDSQEQRWLNNVLHQAFKCFYGSKKTISKSILSYSLIKAFLLKSSTGIKWIGM